MATLRKRGSKWQAQVRKLGAKPISKSFHRKEDATLWAREQERQIDLGELSTPSPSLTLGDLVERYLAEVTPKKRSSKYETQILRAFLRHPMASRSLTEARREAFCAYREERLQEITPASLRRQLTPLHHMFEIARDEWGIPIRENPVRVRLNGVNTHRERRLKEGELKRLLEVGGSLVKESKASLCGKQSSGDEIVRNMVHLAVLTAMRQGELLRLTWPDVHPESIFIRQTKNDNPRHIPLSPEAISVLDNVRKDGLRLERTVGRVFPIAFMTFRRAWDRLRTLAGSEDLHFHDLRHEAISRLFEKGLTVPEVALISGHKDPRMLFRYAHSTFKAALEKLRA